VQQVIIRGVANPPLYWYSVVCDNVASQHNFSLQSHGHVFCHKRWQSLISAFSVHTLMEKVAQRTVVQNHNLTQVWFY
jgi:hypothetical protein